MADKNIDMFKLVEEVEKQRSMNIDEIFSTLDSVKEDNQEPVNDYNSYTTSSDPSTVVKPELPYDLGSYDTRFELFRNIIERVSYGSSNVNEYVEGHKEALEKYYRDAYNNKKDLYVVEGAVSDEISRFTSRSNLYKKGYYDGLLYVYNALKKSKELLMAKINNEINKKL